MDLSARRTLILLVMQSLGHLLYALRVGLASYRDYGALSEFGQIARQAWCEANCTDGSLSVRNCSDEQSVKLNAGCNNSGAGSQTAAK